MTKDRSKFNFENLIVYQKSLDYIDMVYVITEKFPQKEMYGLASQFRNAANSVALNIGEGSAGTVKEFKNFIRISYRSLNECVVCTTLAHRRGYIYDTEKDKSREAAAELIRMLSGLRNSLERNDKK
jgi:four helix bundle protein